jgi:hypothetical protein
MGYIFKKLSHHEPGNGEEVDRTVIDVDVLPTENIDNGKIYRTNDGSSTTYGIPDMENTKTVYEHNGSEWVEYIGSNTAIKTITVYALPTDNIDTNAIYILRSAGMYIDSEYTYINLNDVLSLQGMEMPVYIVDVLPEYPSRSTIYVHNETGIAYVSNDGTSCNPLSIGLFGGYYTDRGWVENKSMMTEPMSIYTLRTDKKYIHQDGNFICLDDMAVSCEFVPNDDGVSYGVNGVVSYCGTVNIPSEHDGYPVTHIGRFRSMWVCKLIIPDTVTTMAEEAFSHCLTLYDVSSLGRISIIPRAAFSTTPLTEILESDNVTEICEHAFEKASLAYFTYFPNLVRIGRRAFRGCRFLQGSVTIVIDAGTKTTSYHNGHLIVPKNVDVIEDEAFEFTSFTYVNFLGTPSSISSSTFNECRFITDIYVPWSEGEVANAPWGAPNATIHYNYVSEEYTES